LLYDSALVRYGEIALKGRPVRRRFEDRLARNIADCLRRNGTEGTVRRIRGRIVVETPAAREACLHLRRVFGVVSCSPCRTTDSRMESIRGTALGLASSLLKPGATFAVDTNRGLKSFALTSPQVNREVGEEIRQATDAKVDLGNPSLRIGIDIRESTYVFHETVPGPGGLPLGTAGRVLSLFSGGIDSPVATYLMMKRGCESDLLYFDNRPFTGEDVLKEMLSVAAAMREYASGSSMRVLVASHGQALSNLRKASGRLTCTLCKRLMVRVGGELCRRRGYDALVSGSSLAQVSSQTMANLSLTLSATPVPVFMPLVGLDKDEIIGLAKAIGTYDASSRTPAECAAVPRHPSTSPPADSVTEAEAHLDLDGMIDREIQGIREIDLP
jgi:thiamine biosynthesis protein ThiI